MPVVFRYEGYRFFFYSNEGSPREPIHIHVRKADKTAKYWIDPAISLSEAFGLTSAELRKLMRIVETNEARIREAWHEHFGE